MIIAAGAFFFRGGHPTAHYLTFYKGYTDEAIYQLQVEPGEILILNYIHSSDRTPVTALFEIQEDGLLLLEEKYSWYGAGLESGTNLEFTFEADEVSVSGYDRFFERLPLRVARTVPQEVVLKDQGISISLNHLAPGGTLLVIVIDEQ